MIYYLTKDSCGCYKIWPRLARPEVAFDGDVSFFCGGIFSDHLGKFEKFFPNLAIEGEYGMKKIEIVEQGDEYFIGELK